MTITTIFLYVSVNDNVLYFPRYIKTQKHVQGSKADVSGDINSSVAWH
jgi:hypothetical protein